MGTCEAGYLALIKLPQGPGHKPSESGDTVSGCLFIIFVFLGALPNLLIAACALIVPWGTVSVEPLPHGQHSAANGVAASTVPCVWIAFLRHHETLGLIPL